MKRFPFLIVFLFMGLLTSAKTLIITLMDDTKMYYTLEEPVAGTNTYGPKMVFENGNIVVKGDSYEFVGIKEFRLSDETDPSNIELGTMSFATTSSVSIYTMDGKKVADAKDMVSVQQINGLDLPKGIYVIRIKHGQGKQGKETSLKFVKK
jgi:hypothetical protein